MTEQVWWYATRAAGMMTWSTAVASVLLGLLLSTRILGKKPSGPWLLDVHRFLGGLSAVFLLVHLGSIWADSYVDFGPKELLVPGASDWNPSAQALGISAITWGIIGAYALIVVEITSILRKYVRASIWRASHYLSVITVAAGSVHAYEAGTDVDNPMVMATAIGSSILIVVLTLVRMRSSSNPESAIAKQRLLEEMRERLDGIPMPPTRAEPKLELDNSDLPRRDPARPDADHGAVVDPMVFSSPADVGAEPDLTHGENTLLTGLGAPSVSPPGSEAGADQLGPDPFAGIQGPDRDFDPGGWASETSTAARETFSEPADVEFGPPLPPESTTEPDAAEPDLRSYLAELQTGTDELPADGDPVTSDSYLAPNQIPPVAAEPATFDPGPTSDPADHEPSPAFEPPAFAPSPGPGGYEPDTDPPEYQPPPDPPPPPAIEAAPNPESSLASWPDVEPASASDSPEPPVGYEPSSETDVEADSHSPETEPPEPDRVSEATAERSTPAPLVTDSAHVDAWESALESLLGKGLPKLPSFEAPEVPTRLADAPEPDLTGVTFAPGESEPSGPVVEAVEPSEPPSIASPIDPATVAPASNSEAVNVPAPPPLPLDAVDPSTGETDEDVYRQWLVEWLAYAERYGDETPADPTRVDS